MSKPTILKSFATVTVFAVATRTLAFLFKVYLSRKVGAEILGLYTICISIYTLFTSLTAGGVSTVLSRKTSERAALSDKDKALSLFTSAAIAGIGIAVILLAVVFTAEDFFARFLSDKRIIPLLKIMLPAIAVTTMEILFRAWLWGRKHFTSFSLSELLEEILRVGFTVLLVSGIMAGITKEDGLAWAFFYSEIAVTSILVVMFLVKGGRFEKPARAAELLKPALPLTAIRVFGSLVGTILSVMLPARLIDTGYSIAEATASIGRISGMANPLLFAPNAIISSLAIVLIPEMSAAHIKGDLPQLNRHIKTGINFAVLISGFFLVAYVALGKEITELIYKDTISGVYLTYAAWLLLITPINLILTSAMNSVGMEKENFYTFFAGTVLLLLCFYFLPRYIGIYAVIVASAASSIVNISGNIWLLRKKTTISLGFLKTVLVVAVIAFPIIYLTKTLYSLTAASMGVGALIVALILSAAAYAGLGFAFNLYDTEVILKFVKKKRPLKSAR